MDEARRWRLDPNISIGHLISTLVLIGGMVGWGVVVESRLAILDTESRQHTESIKDLRQDGREHIEELLRRLDRLDNKADQHLQQHLDGFGQP